MKSQFSFSNIFSEFKHSIRLALPLIASEVMYALNGFFATAMVAHLGKEQLAANALAWGIYITVIVTFIGILGSVSIMVAQSFGAKDKDGVSICLKQGLIMAIIFALPMMSIMWLAPIVLTWTGQDPDIIQIAVPLFRSLIWTMPFLNITFVIYQFLVGLTRTRIVMLINIISMPIQILLFYGLLFGKMSLPKLGLAGIGYGILVENFFAALFFLIYLYSSSGLKIYGLFEKWWVINRKFLFEMIRIGLPMGTMIFIEVALFSAVAIMMGKLGTNTLAAYQISYQYLMIALVIIFALTQTATIRVGYEVGSNNRQALKLAAVVNIAMSLCLVAFFSIFYIFFPLLAVGVDIDVHLKNLQPVIREASAFLSIVGILLLTDSLRLISLGALRGLKDTKFPMFVSIVGFWGIAFPAAYLFGFRLKFGGAGIWWGIVSGLFVAGIILFSRFNRLVQKVDLAELVTKS